MGYIKGHKIVDSKAFGQDRQCNDTQYSDAAYLFHAGFTPSSLKKLVSQEHLFHKNFLTASESIETGLYIPQLPAWGEKFIRRSGSVPQAVLAKLGSNNFCKRRPAALAPFLSYIQKRYEENAFLHFRLVVGPVKNVQLCGARQQPDLAEYLMFLQLAKIAETLASLYPYGIKIQMIPDDRRGITANRWPVAYRKRYISGLRQIAEDLQFSAWLDVEEGQSRMYALYDVEKYFDAAEKEILHDPDYQRNLTAACIKAEQNFVPSHEKDLTESAIRESALRYLVNHRAEILSGMWSPEDAFPLVYANHPGNYQLYTMGTGSTKLPWQIRLPFSVLKQEMSYERDEFLNA